LLHDNPNWLYHNDNSSEKCKEGKIALKKNCSLSGLAYQASDEFIKNIVMGNLNVWKTLHNLQRRQEGEEEAAKHGKSISLLIKAFLTNVQKVKQGNG